MAVKQNQGFRRDLNFEENTNDVQALSNLGGVGVAGDLRVIQNNLRNTSYLGFNSVNLTTNEFSFDTDKVLNIDSIKSEQIDSTSSLVTVTTDVPYNTYKGDLVVLENVNVTGTASTFFNGSFITQTVGTGGTFYTYRVNNVLDATAPTSGLSTATITFKSNIEFVYTKDDIVTVSQDVSVGSTTLKAGTEYFICGSDAETKFQLSFTPSTNIAGISTIDLTATPPQFDFIRKEPVIKKNLDNFQRPEIQDENEFSTYLAGSINDIMDSTQENGENANYFITKKYKGTEDTTVDTDIKFEGTVNLFDPQGFNANSGDLTDPKSPGIFIGNTRAFSADNNPWFTESQPGVANLTTNSFEVSIGELEFLGSATQGAIAFEGISAVAATSVEATTFTHKIPVTINGETYYLLLKQS